uniref:Outer membrane protein S1 precuror n=1 Tax=Edwardsiella tarda TaxID=636 RepID=Q4ACC8_EDWTA|nr:outer membrane protein S1 precuror [Edwardsiella tarda]
MKYKYLAVVFPALLAAGVAHGAEVYNKNGNKVDIYGRLAGEFYSGDGAGDDSYARIGFKGETQINTMLTGYARWEFQAKASRHEGEPESYTRLGFVGLNIAQFGSLDYGRNNGVLKDVENLTDVFPVYGGDSYAMTDNYMTGRANNLLTYRNRDFFGQIEGLNITLQYQGKNEGTIKDNDIQSGTGNRGDASARRDNGDGAGIAATYELPFGIGLAAGYSSSDRTTAQASGTQGGARGEHAEAWTIAAKYDANNIYLAAMYAETRNMTPFNKNSLIAKKTQNIEAVAQYQFDFGLRPSLGYVLSRGLNLDSDNAAQKNASGDLVNYISIGTEFALNKNMVTYIEYKVNLLKDNEFSGYNNIDTDNQLGVGIQYNF